MKKIYLSITLLISFISAKAQFSSINTPIIGVGAVSDAFQYNGYAISNYSLGWYYPQGAGVTPTFPPTAYFSSYNGFQFFANSQPVVAINANGYMGIGTSSPQGNLDIFNTANTTTTPLIAIRSNFHVAGNYGMIKFGDYTQTTDYQKGAIIYESVAGSARGKFHIALENTDGSGSVALSDAKLTVLSNGNVGIGTTIPDQLLSVRGIIHAQQVNIDMQVQGPDYVFNRNYKLRSLAEVNRYITANKHLPEIPSAKSMEKTGINVTELNMQLLKKVEELTLYLIDKDKQIDELKRQQAEDKRSELSKIERLQKQVEALIKLSKNTNPSKS